MKILVTGCNGQLGTEMRNVLEEKMPGKTIYTDIAELDLTDAQAVKAFVTENEVTHIVNCAAYTAVDKAETDRGLCTKINVDAVKNLADAAYDAGAKVVHVSTDYVFDGKGCRPYTEADTVHPVSQYGVTKRKGETTLLALLPDAVIVRTAWLYSPTATTLSRRCAASTRACGARSGGRPGRYPHQCTRPRGGNPRHPYCPAVDGRHISLHG